MSSIVDLKIELDLLRNALEDEFQNGCSIQRVKNLHASIRKIEKILADLKETVKINN